MPNFSIADFETIVENIPTMVFVVSSEGHIEFANRRFLSHVGRIRGNTLGHHWLELLRPAEILQITRTWQDFMSKESAFTFSFKQESPDGDSRWYEVRFQPSRSRFQGYSSWYGILDDITVRRSAEDALRKGEGELQTLIDAIPALVWRAGPSGEFEYMNQRLVDYLGVSISQLRGQSWCPIIHPDDHDASFREWSIAFDGKLPYDATFRYRRADGVFRRVRVIAEPVHDRAANVTRWYGLYIDVEESKALEEALQSSQLRLARAAQLATIAELSASIAHEVNQPLAAVAANAEACMQWLSSSPPNIHKASIAAERIRRDGAAAAEVVRRVRSLFKQEAPTIVPLQIHVVIGEVLRLLRNARGRQKIEIATHFEKGLPMVAADKLQIQQVIMNLVMNAIEAMDDTATERRKIVVSVRRCDDGQVIIEIQDEGKGLTDPTLIFEPFFTSKERGMGIGLSLCRSIVQLHGGQLWATNNESGPGATFRFSLPTYRLPEEPATV
jgi:PAS domain S-box-containing protein